MTNLLCEYFIHLTNIYVVYEDAVWGAGYISVKESVKEKQTYYLKKHTLFLVEKDKE